MITCSAVAAAIAEFFFFHWEQLLKIDYFDEFYKYEYFLGKDADVLYIKGICSSLEDTIEIDDLFYYDSLTTDKNRYSIVSGSPVLTYSSNGLNVNTSVAQIGLVKNNFLTLPSDYEAEITITLAFPVLPA